MPPALSPGAKLGPYEIVALLGEGGMGEVWQARDPRLNRTVAIKVSKSEFNERFQREARAIAALNHPHICQIYDVGPDYLVMEHVEGAPIDGPMAADKAVEFGCQILDTLDAAHKKGITHRDLKPANILVTKQGIKLLDFGLAKQSAAVLKPTDSTLVAGASIEGQISGTLQYMAPEQLQGNPADARSDLFSFGCVLYEMLSGTRAFDGKTAAGLIAAVIERDPAPLEISPALDRVLRTCLAKDPELRFQTAVDLKRNLRWAMEQTAQAAAPTQKRNRLWLAAIPVALAAGAFAWAMLRPQLAELPNPPTRVTRDGKSFNPALSPDGKLLAFVTSRQDGNLDVYVQQSNGTTPIRITDDPAADTLPAFSADGSKIYFTSARDPAGIYEVPALGGDARLLIARAYNPKPSPDGKRIAYLFNEKLFVNSIPPNQQIAISETFVGSFTWSPDGLRLMAVGSDKNFVSYSVNGQDRQPSGLTDNLRNRRMSTPVTRVFHWFASGGLLYGTDHGDSYNIWRIPLSQASFIVPTQVTAGTYIRPMEATAAAGKISYATDYSNQSLWSLPCDMNSGKVTGPLKRIVDQGQNPAHPDITPDGIKLVYNSRGNGPQGIWIKDIQTGKERMVAQESYFGEDYSHVAFSPDGKQIAAALNDIRRQTFPSGWGLVLFNSAGGTRTQISNEGGRIRGWTPDSRYLLLWGRGGGRTNSIEVLDIASGARSVIVPAVNKSVSEPRLSRDGRWLTFREDGGWLYVAPFHGNQPIHSAEWIKVVQGAGYPAWSPDGNTLYYILIQAGFSKAEMFMQPLNPITKAPSGPARLFFRFEGLIFNSPIANPIAVARDQIVVQLTERVSDIWSMDLKE